VTDSKFAKKSFDDAMKYFRDKNIVTKATFDRLVETAKRKAFTVAALTQEQMVAFVHAELARQIGKGANIREFRTFLKGRFEEAGFTAATPRAEAAYIDNVFRTNTLGAYNAGRYERQTQPEVLKFRPYWQIRTVSDNRRRPTHAKADGLVLRADDPFWNRCYPPMGFSCRCRCVTLSKKQAEKMVITNGSTIDYLPDPGFTSGVKSLLSAQWPRNPVDSLLLGI
jgi:SPP1 gp7 family putative phage head morphogenesis protein